MNIYSFSSGDEIQTDGRTTTDGRMDRHTDSQREIIIPARYCMTQYKNEGRKEKGMEKEESQHCIPLTKTKPRKNMIK